MTIGRVHIPVGIAGIILGVIFFIFGDSDPFYV